MKGIKSLKLGLAGVAAGAFLLAGSLLLVGQVSAITGNLSVTDGSAAPGEEVSVDLVADVGGVGLGAWTVDISYDTDVVSVVDCEPEEGGVCNPEFAADAVRITGASASGIDEETVLGTITFECADAEGSTDLDVTVEVFADATVGAPADIDETVDAGSIECAEADDTPVPATATPGAGGLPPTGSAGSTSGMDISWLIASLAGLGVVALMGYGVLRVRTRSW